MKKAAKYYNIHVPLTLSTAHRSSGPSSQRGVREPRLSASQVAMGRSNASDKVKCGTAAVSAATRPTGPPENFRARKIELSVKGVASKQC